MDRFNGLPRTAANGVGNYTHRNTPGLETLHRQNMGAPTYGNSQTLMLQDALDLSDFRAQKIISLTETIGHRDAEISCLKKENTALEVQVARLTGKFNPTPSAILLAGFTQPPTFRRVLNTICHGRVYSIQRFAIKKTDGEYDHFVIVAFVEVSAAYAFVKQYPILQIGDDRISVIHETTPKTIPAAVAKISLGFPVRTAVIDHPMQYTRIIAIWKPKTSFPKHYIDLVEQGNLFERQHRRSSIMPHQIQGWQTPCRREYAKKMGFPSFDPEQVVAVDQVIRRRKPGIPFDTHIALKIEYTSIENCLKTLKEMKEDEAFKDCLYEVLQDYCETGTSVSVKGVAFARPITQFSPPSSSQDWRELPQEGVTQTTSLLPLSYQHRARGIVDWRDDPNNMIAKDSAIVSYTLPQAHSSPMAKASPAVGNSWQCDACGYGNPDIRDVCWTCGQPRNGSSTTGHDSNKIAEEWSLDNGSITKTNLPSRTLQRDYNLSQNVSKLQPFNEQPVTSSMTTPVISPSSPIERQQPIFDVPIETLASELAASAELSELDDTQPESPIALPQIEDKQTDLAHFFGIA